MCRCRTRNRTNRSIRIDPRLRLDLVAGHELLEPVDDDAVAINEVTLTNVSKERAAKAYMQPQTATAEAFRQRVERDWELWGKVIRENNLMMK